MSLSMNEAGKVEVRGAEEPGSSGTHLDVNHPSVLESINAVWLVDGFDNHTEPANRCRSTVVRKMTFTAWQLQKNLRNLYCQ
jgi:hypothetical protein